MWFLWFLAQPFCPSYMRHVAQSSTCWTFPWGIYLQHFHACAQVLILSQLHVPATCRLREHRRSFFLSLQDIPASWLLISANLNKWHIFSQMSHTSLQRIKRSRSHWLESFFCSCLNLFPFLFHACLPIHVKIKDKLKKITVEKSLVLQTIAFNPLPKIIFLLLSLLKANCQWIVPLRW